jgi:hypothetical protein
MTNFTNCTIIVLAEDRTKAQDVTTTEYFNAQASADGQLPVTHYFTSGPFSNEEVDALVNTSWPKWVRSDDWQSALSGLGLVQVIPVEEPVISEVDPSVVLTVPPVV